MSWQEYVDSSLVGSGNVQEAAIIGFDGIIWATSATLKLNNEDCQTIIKAYAVPTSSINLCGEKYILLRSDERSIYLRKANMGACIVKTGQCILIGIYDSQKVQPGDATKTVEELADYLLSVGY